MTRAVTYTPKRYTVWARPWLVAVYFLNADGTLDLESARTAQNMHRGYTNRVVGNFHQAFYPTKHHLPIRRIEVDLFPDLRR